MHSLTRASARAAARRATAMDAAGAAAGAAAAMRASYSTMAAPVAAAFAHASSSLFSRSTRLRSAAFPYSSVVPAALSAASRSPNVAPFGARSMFIQTQSTPNPLSLKFLPGRDVSPRSAHDFSSFRAASAASPLAALLFGISGVKSVYLGPDFISINVSEGTDWALLKPELYAAIMDFYASGKPVVYENPGEGGAAGEGAEGSETQSSTTILPGDSEVVAMIKELIETRIRPAVQEDGGDIDYRSFDESTGVVKVSMRGACKGCSSSAITLKNGIENMLCHYCPEVKSVEEEKDEAAEAVSAEALKKLEEKLAKVTPIPTASAE